ncbi:replication protein A 70 kDa DNA-binding subunit B-like [Solanum verrucosum]|uniref:replication protein A 70 kDa DNA-binding subunit B-like n=1 Tax=Solanum verrucosum TaxID=315347 RepID=UPI0020D097BB|nr:replication protein A 70 kDa DNA-binding subunit B-like [Solanum verrucosum]
MLHTITRRYPHQSSPYTITPNVNIVSLISPGTCIHPDITEMAAETELAKQSLLINNIPKNSVDSVMRVLVIRRGSIIPYKNSKHEGTFRTIILVDEEGTKIQATLFNKHIETRKDSLKPNKSYYIAKGRLDHVNPNYSSVHKEVELAFTDNTIIQETKHAVSTHKFSDGFLSVEHADKLPNGAILDLICVLVSVNLLIQNVKSKRREIVVTNQLREIIKADNKDLTITPTKVMKRAIEVPLAKILDGFFTDSEDCMYKFKATIKDILNKDEPWYSACKKCHKKVQFIEDTAACNNCNSDNVEYEMQLYCF